MGYTNADPPHPRGEVRICSNRPIQPAGRAAECSLPCHAAPANLATLPVAHCCCSCCSLPANLPPSLSPPFFPSSQLSFSFSRLPSFLPTACRSVCGAPSSSRDTSRMRPIRGIPSTPTAGCTLVGGVLEAARVIDRAGSRCPRAPLALAWMPHHSPGCRALCVIRLPACLQAMWACGLRAAASRSSTARRTFSSWRRWALAPALLQLLLRLLVLVVCCPCCGGVLPDARGSMPCG